MNKKIAIIGGKLQGLEAVSLASACGYESILIDKDPKTPAGPLASRFVIGDVVARDKNVIDAMKEANVVLPANENYELLQAICQIAEEENLKLAFDMNAYMVSSSKIKSDKLFHENGIPAPKYYPDGCAPYIIKPSEQSGSKGVLYAETVEEVETFLTKAIEPSQWVIEEFLTGPSYSIEVIGRPGNYMTYQVTEIHMDEGYDCNQVTAPVNIPKEDEKALSDIAVKTAEILGLHGIMDVEVIHHNGEMKVLEIDARIPSQTPLAILESSGSNFVEQLAEVTETGDFVTPKGEGTRPTSYEHYMRRDGRLFQGGECFMTEAGTLHRDEKLGAVWDYEGIPGQDFSGIFILSADTEDELLEKRKSLYEYLKMLP